MPSVDVMMKSAAEVFDEPAIGVILTGMGADGAQGIKALHGRGSITIGQDEGCCVVYGMPKACAEMGTLDKQLALDEIPAEIVKTLSRESHPVPAAMRTHS